MKLAFQTLDVFTRHRFGGNPLAVVLEADALTPHQMQSIAREFNYSETVFCLEPRDPINTNRIKIFTPTHELPFAGHPIIGTAVLIGHTRARDMIGHQDVAIVLETQSGPITCTVRQPKGHAAKARFEIAQEPEKVGTPTAHAFIAEALGLLPDAIGFGDHVPSIYSAGLPFTFVPVKNRQTLRSLAPIASLWQAVFGGNSPAAAYIYTPQSEDEHHAYAARMFFPSPDLREDPATGSAAAAFAGVIMQFDAPKNGSHFLQIEQGTDMGRESLIELGLEVEENLLTGASIGGEAIFVMQGTIDV